MMTKFESGEGPEPPAASKILYTKMLEKQNIKKTGVGQGTQDDISKAIEGIQAGRLSPRMTDYSFRDRTAVAAEAERAGINLNKLAGEYNAVQKYIQSANGPTQIRLRQAIGSVRESIGNLRKLNGEFERTGWTPANKAELTLALSGTDPTRRDAATRYITQLTTIKDELAQAFMGGNSPTDRAIQLAEDILNKNYGFDQLNAALDEVDNNLKYRLNAIYNIGPSVPGGYIDNPNYMPEGKPSSERPVTGHTNNLSTDEEDLYSKYAGA